VFFFQAEDGIRDRTVTGVQTCALPICVAEVEKLLVALGGAYLTVEPLYLVGDPLVGALHFARIGGERDGASERVERVAELSQLRSEERRVGKEARVGVGVRRTRNDHAG